MVMTSVTMVVTGVVVVIVTGVTVGRGTFGG
jgi:hypothetical protein